MQKPFSATLETKKWVFCPISMFGTMRSLKHIKSHRPQQNRAKLEPCNTWRLDLIWFDLIWFDLIWFDLTEHDIKRCFNAPGFESSVFGYWILDLRSLHPGSCIRAQTTIANRAGNVHYIFLVFSLQPSSTCTRKSMQSKSMKITSTLAGLTV